MDVVAGALRLLVDWPTQHLGDPTQTTIDLQALSIWEIIGPEHEVDKVDLGNGVILFRPDQIPSRVPPRRSQDRISRDLGNLNAALSRHFGYLGYTWSPIEKPEPEGLYVY